MGKAWTIPAVYFGSYAWRDCDNIGHNVGADPKIVADSILSDMREESETDRYNCDLDNHDDCNHDDLVWYGVDSQSLLSYARDLTPFERDDLMTALRTGEVARLSAY